jgi:hypothetical protein
MQNKLQNKNRKKRGWLKEAVFRNFCDRQATTGKHLTKMTGKRKNVNKKIK